MAGSFFLDTYAILALFQGSPAYRPYTGSEATTLKVNVVEACIVAVRTAPDRAGALAAALLREYGPVSQDFPLELAPQVALFRHRERPRNNQGKRFSLVDSLGYAFARENGLAFLTGDEGFRGMAGVEWVR